MRLQLATVAILVAAAGSAHADGALSMRGVYYKERSTRVVQPMLDGLFEVGERGLVTAHLLVDAITSASAGSGAASAAFTEKRYEAGVGYTREIDAPHSLSFVDRFRIGGEGKYSTESDYRSLYVGARAEADLAQKNAMIGLGGGVSADTLNAAGTQNPLVGQLPLQCNNASPATMQDCSLTGYSGFASVSQITSKNSLVGVSYDVTKLHGFQANPYRQVLTGDGFVAEKHPNDRLRQALAVSARYFVTASQTTLVAAYRYYRDDWKIRAHTPELRIIQQVGSVADASVRYRYYTQTAAFFYERRYGSSNPAMNATPYFTDDPKMSPFTGHILEAKLGVNGEAFELGGKWGGARFEGVLEYILQHNRFGNAVVAHVAITVPFDY
jgi:hypothetical protein